MEYIASLSYGKDSMYMLEIIHKQGLPLDHIITADVWATPTIPAELPPVIEFKKYADKQIKARYGIEVEHLRANKSYEEVFYTKTRRGKHKGEYYGFPIIKGAWCNSELKRQALSRFQSKYKERIQYIGYAIDEKQPKRQEKIKEYLGKGIYNNYFKYPLCNYNITEKQAFNWCKENNLLSPTYNGTTNRGGCWFCHNQRIAELRNLRKEYPQFWEMLLKWDSDSHTSFRSDGTTVHDLEQRFDLEDRQIKWF